MSEDKINRRFQSRQKRSDMSDRRKRSIDPDLLEEEEQILANTPPVEPIHRDTEPGRNDPCPCGSGKKYKKCCAGKAQ